MYYLFRFTNTRVKPRAYTNEATTLGGEGAVEGTLLNAPVHTFGFIGTRRTRCEAMNSAVEGTVEGGISSFSIIFIGALRTSTRAKAAQQRIFLLQRVLFAADQECVQSSSVHVVLVYPERSCVCSVAQLLVLSRTLLA
jgi:hypothetical protein